MNIKKFYKFINENYKDLGEKVESLYDEQYIKNIVNKYLKNIDPSIRLANAIDLLKDKEKSEIKRQIDFYLKNGIQEKEPIVSANTILDENNSQSDKSSKIIFKSFLKCVTALGGKDNIQDYDYTPNDFLIYYKISNIPYDKLEYVFKRYRSLSNFTKEIKNEEVSLYFGIDEYCILRYGILDEETINIGEIKINNRNLKWLSKLESKSAKSIKEDIHDLAQIDIINLIKIKKDLYEYNPGYFNKKSPIIFKDKMLSISYYGTGNWINGNIVQYDLKNIKKSFNNWILQKDWKDIVLYNVSSKSFWINFYIKLK